MSRLAVLLLFPFLGGCAAVGEALNKVIPIYGEDGEVIAEASVGDLMSSSGVIETAGNLGGGAVGNPMIGIASAAGLASLLLSARKKAKAKRGG